MQKAPGGGGASEQGDEHCTISQHWERRCQTDEAGVLRCETLKRMYRHCPGRPPEEISVTKVEDEGEPMAPSFGSSPPSLGGHLFGGPFFGRGSDAGHGHGTVLLPGPEAMFQQFDAMVGQLFGEHGDRPLRRRPPTMAPLQQPSIPPNIRVDEV